MSEGFVEVEQGATLFAFGAPPMCDVMLFVIGGRSFLPDPKFEHEIRVTFPPGVWETITIYFDGFPPSEFMREAFRVMCAAWDAGRAEIPAEFARPVAADLPAVPVSAELVRRARWKP